jgi:sugar lactone lactonase YvrE
LWRDYPEPIRAGQVRGEQRIDILIPGEDWQLVAEGYRFTEGPAVNSHGEVFFTDIPNNRIHKVGLDGQVSVFAEDAGGANGLMFAADGRLYACANGKQQIVAYDDAERQIEVVAEGFANNDLVIGQNGIYVTNPTDKRVHHIAADGSARVVDEGIEFANGIALSPDQSLLYVADTRGQFVYSFQVQPDGSLKYKQPFFHLHIPYGATDSGADGMTVDTEGRLYVTTRMGVQVCDQPGRVNVILAPPQDAWLSNVVFGGADWDTLYVTCGDKVYKRRINAHGLAPGAAPVQPPRPRL